MKHRLRSTLLALAAVLTGGAFASPVTAVQAEKAVGRWLKTGRSLSTALGRAVASSRTLTATNGAAFHVVRLNGGGFVVTSGDTKLEPVVAYSTGDDLIESEENPLWILLRQDAALRAAATGLTTTVKTLTTATAATTATTAAATASTLSDEERKWSDLLADDETPTVMRVATASRASVADVRVAPLVQSSWGQGAVGGKNVYNSATPENCVCGCVATAGAQILRYFQWPKTAMSQFTCAYCKVNETQTTLTTEGGTYDWANMPLKPTYPVSDTVCAAIGKLTSDLGICCGMKYTTSSSGTGGYMLVPAFKDHFGYANAIAMLRADGCTTAETKNALVSNFDAGLPVAVGITGDSGGHMIVGDGYGYDSGTLYYHFNLGWGGSCDAWYAPPDLSAGGYTFTTLNSFVYNIYTNGNANAVICSGRVVDAAGQPIQGATVQLRKSQSQSSQTTTTNEKGIYAFIVLPGSSSRWRRSTSSTYTLIATKDAVESDSLSVTLSQCTSLNVITEGSYFGYYNTNSSPSVGNLCDQEITLDWSEPEPATETSVTEEVPIPVAYDWLSEYYPSTDASDYASLVTTTGANGRTVWESYLLGLDPTSATNDFTITSFTIVDGEPVLETNANGTRVDSLGYAVKVKGKTNLADGEWQEKTSTHRFFKVFVEPK